MRIRTGLVASRNRWAIIGGIRWPVASAAGNLESSLSWLIRVIVSYVALVLVLLGSGGEVHHPSVSR